MTRHRTVLTLPLAVLGVLAATALPADAASHVHTDAAGDVRLAVEEGAENPTVPDNRSADVVRARTAYAGGVVRLAATLRTLPTSGRYDFYWRVRTDAASFGVTYSGRGAGPKASTSVRLTGGGSKGVCPGLATSLRGPTLIIALPATCLGSPASIRTGLRADVRNNGGPGYFLDDAEQDGLRSLTGPTALGPRVTAD